MDAKERFGDRVEDYERYRPRYPAALAQWFADRGVGESTIVADIGAGTGILSELLLGLGATVFLVEPNSSMRERAGAKLSNQPKAILVDGSAESTGLGTGTVNWVTVAQALHWFDLAACTAEFQRILQPGGQVAVVYNDRRAGDDPFMKAYEAHLQAFGDDYATTTYRVVTPATLETFFRGSYEKHRFDNQQLLDEAGLMGRFFSSSYTPPRDHPRFGEAMEATRALFRQCEQQGVVTLTYYTWVYCGSLQPT